MRKLYICALILLFFCLPVPARAAILISAEPGVQPQLVAHVQKVAAAFDQILAGEVGAALSKDVRIIITPNRDAYIHALQSDLGISREVAERSGKMTSGFSSARRQAVALNGDLPLMKSLGGVTSVVAHELFHQVQGQLEGPKWVRLYWLSEGTADYVGAMVAERLGVMSLDGWKQQRINLLRKKPGRAKPSDLADIQLAQWSSLMEQDKLPYAVSDMMVVFLLEQGQSASPAAIAEYFRQCNRLQDGNKAMKSAFGLDMADFSTRFEPWFASLMTQAATLRLTPSGSLAPSLVSESQRALQALTAVWEDQWNFPLQSNLRLIPVGSADEYRAAASREFGQAPDVAGKSPAETWRFNRSVAIFRLDTPGSPELRARRVTEIAARMWVADTAPAQSPSSLFWLRTGGSLGSAALATDTLYPGAAARQRQLWLNRLGEEKPLLSDLASLNGYLAATKKYGAKTSEALSALAVWLLFEKYGPDAYGHWLRAAKLFADDGRAFASVYGCSPEEFAAEFAAWLQHRSKKAA